MALVEAPAQQNLACGDQEDEGVPDSFISIEKLTEFGINAGDLTKVKDNGGIHTVNGLLMSTKKDLAGIKGLSDARVEKMLDAARKALPRGLGGSSFITGNACLQKRKDVVKIKTGVDEMDEMLGGGIESMAITEVYGEFRCGKTQIAHTLCVTAMLPNGGWEGRAAYVDTEGTFRPERIRPIAERFGLDPDAVLENIVVARAYTHEQQADLITQVAALMSEGDNPFRLLVVDSITALFRADFSGRGELAERQQRLMQVMSKLIKISEEFNVAVFITNQVISDPGAGAMFVSDPKKPAGGHVLAHCSTTRISLRKGKGEQRVAKIVDSPNLPETEASYQISAGGIVNYTGG